VKADQIGGGGAGLTALKWLLRIVAPGLIGWVLVAGVMR